jgi:AcrR family transcriptional regulator
MAEPGKNDKEAKAKIIVKEPTQKRSKKTVETIMDACARLLVKEGFYEMTTDKIAKEANVSIGSLYQFFGNKESVVQALVKNIILEDQKYALEQIIGIELLPVEERLRKIIQVGINIARRDSELRSKIISIQYYVAESSFISDSINFYRNEIIRYLPPMPGRDMNTLAYVMVNAFMGLTNSMAMDKPEAIHSEAIEKEVMHLFMSFLDQRSNQNKIC